MVEQERGKNKVMDAYAQDNRSMGMGIHFAVSTLLGAGAGWWLDGKLSTLPLFFVTGMLFGAVAGFYHLYKTLMEIQQREKEGKEMQRREKEGEEAN